ncbi:MAG: hypothetical protein IJM90_01035 [Firmicutes bacterium]|nr:hypothetical protein [Bacillota bacterium]
MDNTFIECMVKRDDKTMRIVKKVGFGALALAVNAVAFVLIPNFFSIVLLVTVLLIFFFWRRIDREYEYIYTDGVIDIDVIYGRSSRKRLLSADAKEFQFISWCKGGQFRAQMDASYDKTLDAGRGGLNDDSYIGVVTYRDKTYKLIFEPDERIVKALRRYIPRKFEEKP